MQKCSDFLMKIIINIFEKDLDRFYLEFKVMEELKSPYVLEVYSMDETKNEYIMEYADCTLFDFIQKNNQKLTFEESYVFKLLKDLNT